MISEKLGHYLISEKIGAGGMGEVYRARDEHLERDVAIKVLPSGTLADEGARKRFRKEALALSKLNHPNIATVFDFDTQDGVDFLVMELVAGENLGERLPGRPLPEKEVLRIGAQMAEGLAAAHEQNVIHRDLKPGNLRLTPDGRLKILDFGLARLLQPFSATAATASLTETQAVVGTLPYMAPEQLRGEKADARSDIYAAGCVLYELATGRRPFQQKLSSALAAAIVQDPPSPPQQLNPQLSSRLQDTILKCLEKEPENRYQSAKELLVDLRRLATPSAGVVPRREPRGYGVWRLRWAAVGLAVVVALAAVLVGLNVGGVRERLFPPAAPQGPPSIAVLPFADMSPAKDQEYFADGLAEELLNRLAKIPELRVVARTSSFQFKGKNEDLRVVGQKLNVGTVLEGSVRKEGNRVRVTAQLINTSDGFQLWSVTYDRQLDDVFAVQDEIARSVAGSLKVTLMAGKAPASRGTNPEAYNAYLQGRYFYERRSKADSEKAVGYYEQAVSLDPDYALAWAGLAEVHIWQVGYGYVTQEEGYQKARQAVDRALERDESLAEGHAAMGAIKRHFEWDWVGADASYQRALSLDPGNTDFIEGAASLAVTLGRFDEAIALSRRAVELDPLSATAHQALGGSAYYAGRLEEAEMALKKAVELNPEYPYAHAGLGALYLAQARPQEALAEMGRETHPALRLRGLAVAYHALGRKKESDTALAELIEKYSDLWAVQVATVYAYRGETDRAFQWLERAYAQHDGGLASAKGSPLLKSLRRDPRWAAFLKKMRLPV